MKAQFYKITCLTNLHVGSGDINFNIVDNEVEKDPVTGVPMIHSSGIKGALRDAQTDKNLADIVFGKPGDSDNSNGGTHKFLDAYMLSRPMRVYGKNYNKPCIPVISLEALRHFLTLYKRFTGNDFKGVGAGDIQEPKTFNAEFISNVQNIEIEGQRTDAMDSTLAGKLEALGLFESKFAVAKQIIKYDLPVVARNCLEPGRKNLWYEQVVPYDSIFYTAVLAAGDAEDYDIPGILQIGGHSSIGCGYTTLEKI